MCQLQREALRVHSVYLQLGQRWGGITARYCQFRLPVTIEVAYRDIGKADAVPGLLMSRIEAFRRILGIYGAYNSNACFRSDYNLLVAVASEVTGSDARTAETIAQRERGCAVRNRINCVNGTLTS